MVPDSCQFTSAVISRCSKRASLTRFSVPLHLRPHFLHSPDLERSLFTFSMRLAIMAKTGPCLCVACRPFVQSGMDTPTQLDALQLVQDKQGAPDSSQLTQSSRQAISPQIDAELAQHQRGRHRALLDRSHKPRDFVPVSADVDKKRMPSNTPLATVRARPIDRTKINSRSMPRIVRAAVVHQNATEQVPSAFAIRNRFL
jgi:hypothetical protein